MLVLTRKQSQHILFPKLGIKVEVLRTAGNSVSLGITAPASVKILRGELAAARVEEATNETAPVQRSSLHQLRNQLHQAQLVIALAQKQLQQGSIHDAEATLERMLQRLKNLELGAAESETISSSHANDASQATMRARHALVVEDDANERSLLAGYLRLCGFQVTEAVDGLDALEFLKDQPVDLVVLDIRMPRMNGLETLRAIENLPQLKHTKVVVVSGEDRQELDTTNCRLVDQWFAKPLNPALLVGHLQSLAT